MDMTLSIGRIGALAVALGIGTAVAGSAGCIGIAAAAPDHASPSPHSKTEHPTSRAKAPDHRSRPANPGSRTAGSVKAHVTYVKPVAPAKSATPAAEVKPAVSAASAKAVPAARSANSVTRPRANSVKVQLVSTPTSTSAAQLRTLSSVSVSSPGSGNSTTPTAPAGSPLALAIAGWATRRTSDHVDSALSSASISAVPSGTTPADSAPATQPVALSPTAATDAARAALTSITAVRVQKNTTATVKAGKATVGAPDGETGVVSGSLNFTTTGTGTPTYSVSSQPVYGAVTVNSNGTFTYTPSKLARDLSAVSANQNTATFTVVGSMGSASASQTVTVPVLATTINGDSTAVLQNVFSNLAAGSTLTMASKTFYHSGVLRITVAGLTINGNGSTLQATNDATSSVQVLADNVSVSNMTFGANLTGARYYDMQQHKLVIEGNHDSVSNVTINGSAGAGVFVYGAGWFNLSGITVNSSRADGIHMTNGAHDGTVTNSVTNNTGDDGIAVVSYIPDGKICYNITINNPVVNGTTWGRGISVVGGQNITYNNIKVSNTNAAGVYIAAEPSYNTMGVNGVVVNGGTVTGANDNPGLVHGAILVYSGNAGQTVSNVTIENLSVSGTGDAAERQLGLILENGATVSAIKFANISIDKSSLLTLYTNAPKSNYTTAGLLVGGILVQV